MTMRVVTEAKRLAVEWQHAVDVETALLLGKYALGVAAGLFVLRTLAVILTRAFGLYQPNQYRFYLRLIPWRGPFRVWMGFQAWKDRVFRLSTQSSGGFMGALAALTLRSEERRVGKECRS